MNDMLDLVVEEFAHLQMVFVRRDEGDLGGVAAILFGFEHGSILAEAQPTDDTISISVLPGAFQHPGNYFTEITAERPWVSAMGKGAIWIWYMANQRGYEDALQIEFHGGGESTIVQVICEASLLRTYSVSPLWY